MSGFGSLRAFFSGASASGSLAPSLPPPILPAACGLGRAFEMTRCSMGISVTFLRHGGHECAHGLRCAAEDDEVDPSVLGEGPRAAAGVEGAGVAVADGADPV